jgi:hypothetical protein
MSKTPRSYSYMEDPIDEFTTLIARDPNTTFLRRAPPAQVSPTIGFPNLKLVLCTNCNGHVYENWLTSAANYVCFGCESNWRVRRFHVEGEEAPEEPNFHWTR